MNHPSQTLVSTVHVFHGTSNRLLITCTCLYLCKDLNLSHYPGQTLGCIVRVFEFTFQSIAFGSALVSIHSI